jgi:hypothetical protein
MAIAFHGYRGAATLEQLIGLERELVEQSLASTKGSRVSESPRENPSGFFVFTEWKIDLLRRPI